VEEAFLQRVGLVEVARHTDPVEVDPVVHDVPSAPVVVPENVQFNEESK